MNVTKDMTTTTTTTNNNNERNNTNKDLRVIASIFALGAASEVDVASASAKLGAAMV